MGEANPLPLDDKHAGLLRLQQIVGGFAIGSDRLAAISARVGRDSAAAAKLASRAPGGQPARRALARSPRGLEAPAAVLLQRALLQSGPSARAISSARNGFPPDASASRASAGRGGAEPTRSRIRWCRAASESGRGTSRSRRSSGNARPRPSGAGSSGSPRRVRRRPTRAGSRRAANESAPADAGSSHWTSSIATRTTAVSASEASTPTKAVAIVRGWTGSSASARRRAAARARCCIGGRALRVCLEVGPDEIRQRRVRELDLGLRRSRLQNADAARLRRADRRRPHGRLADPGLPLDEQRRWAATAMPSRKRPTRASSASRPTTGPCQNLGTRPSSNLAPSCLLLAIASWISFRTARNRAELRVAVCVRGARARPRSTQRPSRGRGQDEHAVGQVHGLVDVVRHVDDR